MKLDPNKILRKLSYSLLMCLLETRTVNEKPNLQRWQYGYLIITVQEVISHEGNQGKTTLAYSH